MQNTHKAGNLEIGAHFYDGKEWCVQIKGPKETLRFFLQAGTEEKAAAQAAILADMINKSRSRSTL